MQALVVLTCVLSFAASARDLSDIYPFKSTLNTEAEGGLYELYWTFDNDAETISFAVRVQTTGWVGFGISPNGQMPDSDVIVGWVTDDGQAMFHDRFARSRTPPAIDEQQDWTLINGEEEDGFTILQFSRSYVTCDEDDLPITTETARVIWSFHATSDPTSEDLSFNLIHSKQGSISRNLLGGLPDVSPDPEDLQYYDVTVNNITIPSKDTTYWCTAFQLPEEIRKQTRYVTKFSPLVTMGNEAHVHHLLIYLCSSVNETRLGIGGDCDGGVADDSRECPGGLVIAAWAVGGEDFVYPENVAYPFGGEESNEFVLIELHYDNPHEIAGTVDSSGMRIWYIDTPREYDAGIMPIGYFVHPFMVIPPNVKNFEITSLTTENCTSTQLPEGGINIFANILHTHVIGHGLTLQHIRYNPDCDVYEELEPIDTNLNYDFNFQQINHLKREVNVLPGDIIQLKCFYGTEGIESVTTGGYSTQEEMCLSWPIYYPRVNLSVAFSRILDNDYYEYLSHFPAGRQILGGQVGYVEGLDAIDWDEDTIQGLQDTYNNGTQLAFCGENVGTEGILEFTKLPTIGCSYIPPDQCSDSVPRTCCERINAEPKTEEPDVEEPETEEPETGGSGTEEPDVEEPETEERTSEESETEKSDTEPDEPDLDESTEDAGSILSASMTILLVFFIVTVIMV